MRPRAPAIASAGRPPFLRVAALVGLLAATGCEDDEGLSARIMDAGAPADAPAERPPVVGEADVRPPLLALDAPARDAGLDRPPDPSDGPLRDEDAFGGLLPRGDAARSGETRGTPPVTDDGLGPARDGAGFFRVAVEAWGDGLSFPRGRRTILDFYYSSHQEVVSTGLGGALVRVQAPGQAAVFRAPFGDELELVLDLAQVPPFVLRRAMLRERGRAAGAIVQANYPGVTNRIAGPPFAGGPGRAPLEPFMPPFFAMAAGTHRLRCTAVAAPLGGTSTWLSGKDYAFVIGRDGTVTIETERAAIVRAWDEAFDTHAPLDAQQRTSVQLHDPAAGAATTLVWDVPRGALVDAERSLAGGGAFETYTFAAP